MKFFSLLFVFVAIALAMVAAQGPMKLPGGKPEQPKAGENTEKKA